MLRFRPRPGLLGAAVAALFLSLPAAAQLTSRVNSAMVLMADGNVMIAGGADSAGTPLNTVQVWISTNGTSVTKPSLNVARTSHTATLLPDGRILVAGGVVGGPAATATAEVFDPRTNAWTTLGSAMQFARYNHTATMLSTGKVLIAGGQTDTGAGTVTTDCDLFNPQTDTFEACGSGGTMQMERAAHTATLLHNGRVFVAGGYRSAAAGFSPTTEVYDPIADRWSAGPALIQARAWHTATQFGDQRILLAGGFNGKNVEENRGILETSEIYDPNSGTITPGAKLQARKMFHTAILDGSGVVSLAGGFGNVTTGYHRGDIPVGGLLVSNPVAGSWLRGNLDSASSTLGLGAPGAPTFILPSPVTGRIVDGDIDLSSPTIPLSDANVEFNYPGVSLGDLDGVDVSAGTIYGSIDYAPFSGTITFAPQEQTAEDIVLSVVSSITASGTITPGSAFSIVSGALRGTLRVPMAQTDVGGTVLAGVAIIKDGAISLPSSDAVQGYDIALTSGIASIVGGTVVNDVVDGPILSMPVTFFNIEGDITSSTTTNISSGVALSGQKITSLTVKLFYVVSPVTLSFQSHVVRNPFVSTISVRAMVFSDNERWNPASNSWSFGQPGQPRFKHSSILFPNEDELSFGGLLCENRLACKAFVYSTSTVGDVLIPTIDDQNGDSQTFWESEGALNESRTQHSLTLLADGRVLAAGGSSGVQPRLSTEVYDPVARTWTRVADLKQKRSHHSANLLTNGTVLIAGGFTSNNQSTGTTNHAEIFYPETNTWVPTGQMISSRAYHAGVLLPNGNVLAIAGFSDGTYLSSCEVYVSTAHFWMAAPSVPVARAQFTATMLRDGRVLVAGGINAANGVLNSAHIFDPQTWTWSATGSLFQGRHSHTATMLPDGRVLVAGGDSGLGEIGIGEVYDPNSGTWTRTTALGGNDMLVPRLNHTATLLPNGKVLIVGGFTRLGGPISVNEGFDVAFTSWNYQGNFISRGDHATVLLRSGYLLAAGGSDGLAASAVAERVYPGHVPDGATPAGSPPRRPEVADVGPSLFQPGSAVTARGGNFRGRTEASGGGGASANSHHAHPRVYLQRAEATSSSTNDSSWSIDLTSSMLHSGINNWSNSDSSLTFTVPYTSSTMPLGWYHLRVAANSQFSKSAMVHVGPALPTAVPGIPVGTMVGPSSIVWTWAAASGSFDGYSVYSATNGVFLSTVAPSGGGTESFLQTGLGPDTSALIKVAAFNVSGDGSLAFATVTLLTAGSAINNLQGAALTEGSILWTWDPVGGATSYRVFSATSGAQIGTPSGAAFTQTSLSTNTSASVRVRAVMLGGDGELSPSVTAYTLAAQPAAGQPPIILVSTGSFVAQWLPNTNPASTLYHIKMLVGPSQNLIHISSVPGLSAGIAPLDPNMIHSLSVAAFNGDGVYTAFTALGSTYTLARPPTNASITANTPSSLGLAWSKNSNPEGTTYQVLYSTDNFVNNVSTHIAFSAAFTSATTNVGSLITGTTYYLRITARNGFGQETAAASVSAFTNNGGGPPGSLAVVTSSSMTTTLSGTLGNGRRIAMTVYPGAFEGNTTVFISSRALADVAAADQCGAIPARISIVTGNGQQPKVPVEFGIQYFPGDAVGSAVTLGIARFDAASRTCVPLESRVDTTNNIVYAKTNHFTDFQLQQIVPSGTVGTARVFPNPLYTASQGYFTFDRLPAGARVRVYTIHGEEVFDQGANSSGIVTWRAQNLVGRPVASGLYLAVIEYGGGKHIMKLAVVR